MRQAARVQVTPIALASLTILMTLLLGAIGGLMGAARKSPADIGAVLFHTFFSLAYFVVAIVGAALGANTIAAEREGRTWEAVLLTGMRPEVVVRGKFASAFTSIALYVVALGPVGALPFLFGGVTPSEVIVAFVCLFVFALLSVAFGLAVSARMQNSRGALVLTMLVAFPMSAGLFGLAGSAGSAIAHRLWSEVDDGGPFWLPSAYASAPFGFDYLLFLVVLPLVAVVLPAWFLYEVTLANLVSITEDRSHRLKRWHVVTTPLLASLAVVLARYPRSFKPSTAYAFVAYALLAHAVFATYVFATEVIGPSRRVARVLDGASRFRRMLAPGVVPTLRLLRATQVAPLALVTVGWVVVSPWSGLPTTRTGSHFLPHAEMALIVLLGVYLASYVEFLLGIVAFSRVRSAGGSGVRAMLVVVLLLSNLGPWVLAAVAGVVSSRTSDGIVVACPSPFYLVEITYDELVKGASLSSVHVIAPMMASLVYAAAGVVLGRRAAARCRAMIAEHEARIADADRRLAEEDAAARDAEASSSSVTTTSESAHETGDGSAGLPAEVDGEPHRRDAESASAMADEPTTT